MKKKECPACAMETDRKADVCPICGYEFPRQPIHIKILVWVMILLLLLYWVLW
ncbi:hypothetical protein [Fodinibius sediminis]|uniref:Uncharacterized protein n=1 Tax=Fodinibius sediminis TaxID=1214077 RepID=A0A521DZV3_9BACT|nr:hypothetical protein [Fodinibius sediminis]SMO76390.1 hypothetical protein SAMN06265218_11240 [Fodinibius sediminis]